MNDCRLFSNPAGSATATTTRKRRALPSEEITAAIIKSSPVPISLADAQDSLKMLVKMCPFFLISKNFDGEEWLEMPAPQTVPISEPSGHLTTSSPGKGKVPVSPGRVRGKHASAEELRTRSPKTVKHQGGGLREVRERIRKELESCD